jgi:hypothetical protein
VSSPIRCGFARRGSIDAMKTAATGAAHPLLAFAAVLGTPSIAPSIASHRLDRSQ